MPGFESLLLTFIAGVIVGKGLMYVLMKIYYNRLLGERRTKNRRTS